MSASIDGLVTGMDTTALISQLMSFERAPMLKMQARQATFDAAAKAWDDIAAKISFLRTAAEAIDTAPELSLFKALSSDPSVLSAVAGKGASPGPVTLRVTALAVAHQKMAGFATTTSSVGAGTALIAAGLSNVGATEDLSITGDFTAGAHTITLEQSDTGLMVSLDGGEGKPVSAGAPVTLDGTTGSMTVTFGATPKVGSSQITVARTTSAEATVTDLARAVTTAGGAATAQVLDLGENSTTQPPARLILTSTETGSAGALTVRLSGFTGLTDAGLSDLRPPADAQVQIGELSAVRSTNSIGDLLPGVTLNLAKESPIGTEVTVTVGTDADAVVAKVKALVDALNGVRSTISKYSTYDPVKKVGGVLLSNPNARSLTSTLPSATGQALPSGDFRTLSQLGISIGRNGTYSFDETKLRDALGTAPAGVATAFAEFGNSIVKWAKDSDGVTGVAYRAKQAAQAQYRSFQTQIDSYEERLEQREARYRAQFSRLETVLGQMQNQSNWLAGQIASLYQ